MKVLDHQRLLSLNESSRRVGRRQNLSEGQLPAEARPQYVVNFHFEHKWPGGSDVRLSVVVIPETLSAWLDVSPEEFAAIPELELSELDWEAAVCVGVPRWTD